MSCGDYRISTEEQYTEAINTAATARIHRLLEVRRQDKSFASRRVRLYQQSVKQAHFTVRKEAERDFNRNKHRCRNLLLIQKTCEDNCVGQAQNNAYTAGLSEILHKQLKATQSQLNIEVERKRFKEAVKTIRKEENERNHRVVRLVARRSHEKENGRILAKKYASNFPKKQQQERKGGQIPSKAHLLSREHSAIDFKFSRLHEMRGMPIQARRTQDSQQGSAMKMATTELERLKHHALEQQKEIEIATGRARDRGEVAFLRERAIVQKQICECLLEKHHREEKKKQQQHMIQKARNCLRTKNKASIQDAEQSIRQLLYNRKNNENKELVNTSTVLRSQSRKQATAQVGASVLQEGDESHFETRVNVDDGKAGDKRIKTLNSTASQKATDHLNNSRAMNTEPLELRVEAWTQTEAIQNKEKTMHDKQTSIISLSEPSSPVSMQIQPPSAGTEDITQHAVSTDGCLRVSDKEQTTGSASPVVAIGGYNSNNDGLTHVYEDSLSEALSLDTDIFLKQYLHQTPHSATEGSLFSDYSLLEDLSSLLESSWDADSAVLAEEGDSFCSTLRVSDSYIKDMKLNREQEIKGTSCSMASLVKGLDKMSEDSVHLLSDLSDILTQTSEDKNTRFNSINDTGRSSVPSLRLCSLTEHTESSDDDYSLILETIAEVGHDVEETEIFSSTERSNIRSEFQKINIQQNAHEFRQEAEEQSKLCDNLDSELKSILSETTSSSSISRMYH